MLSKSWESLRFHSLSRLCGIIWSWESAGLVEAVCEAGPAGASYFEAVKDADLEGTPGPGRMLEQFHWALTIIVLDLFQALLLEQIH